MSTRPESSWRRALAAGFQLTENGEDSRGNSRFAVKCKGCGADWALGTTAGEPHGGNILALLNHQADCEQRRRRKAVRT